MTILPEELLKIGLAILVGGLIGGEREFRDKSAGFRTIIFITLGSTIYTIFSLGIGSETNPTRIAANIVTGIGFLGAGAILRDGARVAGLTTAATIWLSAALGMGIGVGKYGLVGAATLTALIVLWIFPRFEKWVDNMRETRRYEILIPLDAPIEEAIYSRFAAHKLTIFNHTEHKKGNTIILTINSIGKPAAHKQLVRYLMNKDDVLELRY